MKPLREAIDIPSQNFSIPSWKAWDEVAESTHRQAGSILPVPFLSRQSAFTLWDQPWVFVDHTSLLGYPCPVDQQTDQALSITGSSTELCASAKPFVPGKMRKASGVVGKWEKTNKQVKEVAKEEQMTLKQISCFSDVFTVNPARQGDTSFSFHTLFDQEAETCSDGNKKPISVSIEEQLTPATSLVELEMELGDEQHKCPGDGVGRANEIGNQADVCLPEVVAKVAEMVVEEQKENATLVEVIDVQKQIAGRALRRVTANRAKWPGRHLDTHWEVSADEGENESIFTQPAEDEVDLPVDFLPQVPGPRMGGDKVVSDMELRSRVMVVRRSGRGAGVACSSDEPVIGPLD